MQNINQESIAGERYDLFISYSMDPDYQLSRRVENFLEGFHKLKVPDDIKLKHLQICRDGSDFSLHKIKKESSGMQQGEDYVQLVLVEYLAKSDYLLVLCAPNAAESKYVNFELDWFIKNKGIDRVLVAVTQGSDLSSDVENPFPNPVIENNLHTAIFYDLRGFKKEAKKWIKVRAFDEELTKLAAHLNDQAPGKILPAWRWEETKKLKRQRYVGGIAALIFLIVAIAAFFQRQQAVKNKNEALENLKKFKIEQFDRNMRNGQVYFAAREYSFALAEFLAADSIIGQYPKDTFWKDEKRSLDTLKTKCGFK